jgi:hypothetical protein
MALFLLSSQVPAYPLAYALVREFMVHIYADVCCLIHRAESDRNFV